MVPEQMGASVYVWKVCNDREGSRTKSESQLRGAHLQLASRKEETQWSDFGNPGHKTQSKCKGLCDWIQEIRSHQFSISHPHSFPSFFSDGLSLTTFFLKACTPIEGVQATYPRVLYPEGISNKERKYWRHQSSRVFSEWPTLDHMYSPRSAILAGPWGPMIGFTWSLAVTQKHTWLSNSSRTTWLKLERQPQG